MSTATICPPAEAATRRRLSAVSAPPVLVDDPAGLFAELARLNLPLGEYVVCGSAVLYVRGLRSRVGDLDVLARGPAWTTVLSLGVPPSAALSGHGLVVNHPTHAIEFVDRWTPGWPTDYLIASADLIDGIPFMRLGDVLAWKQRARRSKDLPDIAAVHELRRLWNGADPAPTRVTKTDWRQAA
ncbi:M20/M25/M40 family metallo-hydrolase [Nonomuraea turkmeniaca]|uniref:M20/M25/M40 family metallo-hydrolase n=1 Tax=Nonomuraea turkmeniaca TaxID=103838 RepID=A0A5S4F7R1_9ACTN|nr:M20/M25/M40 family metallo-hydrolase [Nonomuraea turkmeniaca]TMR12386.1 M20/M25/M40 family metallo-hydrolase [Nonomuraea turkmeniaca]